MPIVSKAEKYFTDLLASNPDCSGWRCRFIRIEQILIVALKDFLADRCLLKASALSFTTILSMVPFLALVFAVLKGFSIQNRLEPFLLNHVAAGSEQAVTKIIQYINNTNVASLGIIGLLVLILTVLSLLDSIEDAFNDIWGVQATRSLYRKFTDYMSVVLVAPLLMFSAVSITTSLKSREIVAWMLSVPYLGALVSHGFGFIPYVSMWLALTLFYLFIPNTGVRLKSALAGGMLAGTLWQLAQWGYIHFQMGVTRYNAIYGAISLVPLIMVWIYTSWVIVLFGGEVAWAHQTLRNYRRGLRINPNHAMHRYIALSLFQMISVAYVEGRPARTIEDMAEELDVPTRIMKNIFNFYENQGVLASGAGDPATCLPAKDIDLITIDDLMSMLENFAGSRIQQPPENIPSTVTKVLQLMDAGRGKALSGMTVRHLACLPPTIDKRLDNGI